MSTKDLSEFIQKEALDLGFSACGFAQAEALPFEEQERFKAWTNAGFHGGMGYMARNEDLRMNPRLLQEGCKSVIVVALNYAPSMNLHPEAPRLARFAYGSDYHQLIRSRLNQLMQRIGQAGVPVRGRAFADSAPIAERYWAWKAGLGWIGRNRHLILPGAGSYFLLGELLCDLELEYGTPVSSRCGQCRRCLEACPTQALSEKALDARTCLSYLTIEKKGAFTDAEAKMTLENGWVFGCDLCQEACPWNRFAQPGECPELQPSTELRMLDPEGYRQLDPARFKALFTGSCVDRTGLNGLRRNLGLDL